MKLRLLLVEDSEDDAFFLLRELERAGYEVVSERVETAEAFVAALRDAWDVVVCDYFVPGFGVLAALELFYAEGLDLPFIAISGAVSEETIVKTMRAGAHDYVMKSNLTRLGPAIEREIREAQNRRERRRAEEKYRSMFENAVYGIFQTSVDGRGLIANPEMARILGYASPEELLESIDDVATQVYVDPDRRTEFARRIREQGVVSDFETRLYRKDGSVIWASVNARALYEDGEISGYEGTVEDVTERMRAEEDLRRSLDRLLALHQAGRILDSTLDMEKIGSGLLELMQRASSLTAAVIYVRDENRKWHVWHTIGPENLWRSARRSPEAIAARWLALQTAEYCCFRLKSPEPLSGLCLPLRVRDRAIGVLESYGPDSLVEQETVEMLGSLAAQAAGALENARLYRELAEREKRLQDLVGKILIAQEEERRRVAYEVHDGLAQIAAAAHQHLQAFARRYPPAEGREDLDLIMHLVRRTVGEARRVIANLRPTALDDLGLAAALSLEVERLRDADWQVEYDEELGDERLPAAVETALFRIAQEALTNARKHAQTQQVRVTIQRPAPDTVLLEVRDWGRGFDPAERDDEEAGPGERVGLSGMRERVSMLGGELEIQSSPGSGTRICVRMSL